MPTIIDSLIVELGLDPKGFDEAQKKSTEALRTLEQNARSAQQPLTDLSAQARRTGTSIAAGTAIGETGLKNLAIAGTEAFAAFKAIEGIISQVARASERGAAVSRAAWAIGLPGGTRQLDALIQAAEEAAHVPQSTSINLLNQYQQRLEENKRTGAWSTEFTEAGRLGVDIGAPLIEQIKQIRAALHGRSGPETEAWANSIGLGPWLQFLKLSQAQADAAERRAGQHSLTGEQGKELERAQTAAVRFENSMVHLWEVLTAKFSKSGFAAALEGWSELIDRFSNADKLLDHFAEVAERAGRMLVLGPLGNLLYEHYTAPAADTRNIWQRNAPSWLGGKPAPQAGGGAEAPIPGVPGHARAGTEYGPNGPGAIPDTPPPGADPAMWAAFKFISRSEGATDNPWNYMHKTGNPIYNASGYTQMLRRNWQKYADPADAAKWNDAVAAPMDAQFRAFSRMFAAEGPRPWTAGAPGGSLTSERIAGLHAAMAAAGSGESSMAGFGLTMRDFQRYRDSHPNTNWEQYFRMFPLVQQQAALSAAQGGGDTHNDVDANIGNINIHTQATDAQGIGGAIGGAIKDMLRQNMMVHGANSGLF